MRKFFIGLAVLAALIAYSLELRHERPKIGMPLSLGVGPSTKTTTTPVGRINSSNSPVSTMQNQTATGAYKDGSYTGSVRDAFYGNVQVRVIIQNGKIMAVNFLQYPQTHETSVYINQQAMPGLQQEAIQAQSANINIVSGATYTSQAFIQSLSNALAQAA